MSEKSPVTTVEIEESEIESFEENRRLVVRSIRGGQFYTLPENQQIALEPYRARPRKRMTQAFIDLFKKHELQVDESLGLESLRSFQEEQNPIPPMYRKNQPK